MIPVSLTGFTGFFIYEPRLSARLFLVTAGILLLAVSASVLNQIQERVTDGMMERTKSRPLPSGRLSLTQASVYFSACLLTGIMLLWFNATPGAVLTGILTIIWYNGVYTYAKRVTSFAVVPGAVTGALPPLIGWLAAGGGAWERTILFVEFLFFIGQIPHFWLLILKYGEEYHQAGMPSLTRVMSRTQINRLTFTWVVTCVIAALFLCYFEIIGSVFLSAVLLLVSVYMVWRFSGLVRLSGEEMSYRPYSIHLYLYFLLLIILLIADKALI
jgi:protoheme IX farnesyltransferase